MLYEFQGNVLLLRYAVKVYAIERQSLCLLRTRLCHVLPTGYPIGTNGLAGPKKTFLRPASQYALTELLSMCGKS